MGTRPVETADEVRALYEEMIPGPEGSPPITRYGKFDRAIVGVLLEEIAFLRHSEDLARTQLAGARGEVGRLHKELADARTELCYSKQRYCEARADLARLRGLEGRVQRGPLTDGELQAICHNLTASDEQRFKLDCLAEWRKLFGNDKLPEGDRSLADLYPKLPYDPEQEEQARRAADEKVLRHDTGLVNPSCQAVEGLVGKETTDALNRGEDPTGQARQVAETRAQLSQERDELARQLPAPGTSLMMQAVASDSLEERGGGA